MKKTQSKLNLSKKSSSKTPERRPEETERERKLRIAEKLRAEVSFLYDDTFRLFLQTSPCSRTPSSTRSTLVRLS